MCWHVLPGGPFGRKAWKIESKFGNNFLYNFGAFPQRLGRVLFDGIPGAVAVVLFWLSACVPFYGDGQSCKDIPTAPPSPRRGASQYDRWGGLLALLLRRGRTLFAVLCARSHLCAFWVSSDGVPHLHRWTLPLRLTLVLQLGVVLLPPRVAVLSFPVVRLCLLTGFCRSVEIFLSVQVSFLVLLFFVLRVSDRRQIMPNEALVAKKMFF